MFLGTIPRVKNCNVGKELSEGVLDRVSLIFLLTAKILRPVLHSQVRSCLKMSTELSIRADRSIIFSQWSKGSVNGWCFGGCLGRGKANGEESEVRKLRRATSMLQSVWNAERLDPMTTRYETGWKKMSGRMSGRFSLVRKFYLLKSCMQEICEMQSS